MDSSVLDRQPHPERRALSPRALDVDRAAVRMDHLAGDPEAESDPLIGAFRYCALEALEDRTFLGDRPIPRSVT